MSMSARFARCWVKCAILFGFLDVLIQAQPVPKITSVSPEWVQRGTASVIALEGENLSQVNGFILSGDGGVTASNAPPRTYSTNLEASRGGIVPADSDEKKLRVSVTALSDAPLGARELRVTSPSGVSAPVTLNVGFLREIEEVEPNNSTNE